MGYFAQFHQKNSDKQKDTFAEAVERAFAEKTPNLEARRILRPPRSVAVLSQKRQITRYSFCGLFRFNVLFLAFYSVHSKLSA